MADFWYHSTQPERDEERRREIEEKRQRMQEEEDRRADHIDWLQSGDYEDRTYTARTGYGGEQSCPMCHRDFSMCEMGTFWDDEHEDEESEPIQTWWECRHCGYRED